MKLPSRVEAGTVQTSRRREAAARIAPERVHEFVTELLGDDIHAARVLSFATGVVGVLHAAALGVHAIGRGLADAMGLDPKHAIKQIDRLLSNTGVTVWLWFEQWVSFVVAARTEIVVALDWTEFDKDDQATIAAYLVTSHGRATPLVWRTVSKSKLKNQRNEHEYQVIRRLHEILPAGVDITLLADRGFGDQKLLAYLGVLGWSYVIRFRQLIHVTAAGRTMPASKWIPIGGHAKMLRDVLFTDKKTAIPAVVLKHQKGMKEAWCLATNRTDLGAAGVVRLYAKRFTIEETFRDIKDNHFGMGLSPSLPPARRRCPPSEAARPRGPRRTRTDRAACANRAAPSSRPAAAPASRRTRCARSFPRPLRRPRWSFPLPFFFSAT